MRTFFLAVAALLVAGAALADTTTFTVKVKIGGIS